MASSVGDATRLEQMDIDALCEQIASVTTLAAKRGVPAEAEEDRHGLREISS